MREKYESLALTDLKAIAKTRGIKGTSTMRKAELVNAMLTQDEIDKAAGKPVEVKSLAGTAAPYKRKPAAAREASGVIKTEAETAGRTEAAGRPDYPGKIETKEHSDKDAKTETTIRINEDGRTGMTARTENAGRGRRPVNGYTQTAGGRTNRRPESLPANRRPESPPPAENRTENAGAYRQEQRQELPEAERRTENASAEPRSAGTPADPRTAAVPAEKKQENVMPNIEVENCLSGLDSGVPAYGILEVMTDGFGFIRSENYLPGEHDVYVAPSQIRRFGLKTGDILEGNTRVRSQQEKFSALLYVKSVNGYPPEAAARRNSFEKMTPIFPDERISLEMPGSSLAMRIMDLISPIGKGQRGMIVSPPKAGKTTLLKEVARSVKRNYPDMYLIILLIDERPEEVTDMKEAIEGPNVEVIYSTFDELPDRHKRVSEMVIERARRLVEHQKDVMILIDSITRLARAYNQVIPPSGRTLSGGLDPAALHMPKRFFGAARNMREGGSLTILATALVDTGSKMDDVVYEEFKGTGNMELVLDRKLSERRVFPAIDIPKSGTRREDLLLTREEMDAINIIRRALTGMKQEEATDRILDMFARTKSNAEFVYTVKKMKFF